jgi:uncharacterized protein (UPF0147 family)
VPIHLHPQEVENSRHESLKDLFMGHEELQDDDPLPQKIKQEAIKRLKHNQNSLETIVRFAERLEVLETVCEFNELMDELYDWADTNRVWIS